MMGWCQKLQLVGIKRFQLAMGKAKEYQKNKGDGGSGGIVEESNMIQGTVVSGKCEFLFNFVWGFS